MFRYKNPDLKVVQAMLMELSVNEDASWCDTDQVRDAIKALVNLLHAMRTAEKEDRQGDDCSPVKVVADPCALVYERAGYEDGDGMWPDHVPGGGEGALWHPVELNMLADSLRRGHDESVAMWRGLLNRMEKGESR
ncbi:MAG: hypothetical protein EBS89_07525 [Proteobacteria bacterium]|nr:hypothetical protein [Pseudomonadota bacterium]